MVNTVTKTTLQDGHRTTIVKINIVGDGSGEETEKVIFLVSDYVDTSAKKKLVNITYALSGFNARLLWVDAASPFEPLISLESEKANQLCFEDQYGGLSNTQVTGATGSIAMTTLGLGAGDHGYIILTVQSKN